MTEYEEVSMEMEKKYFSKEALNNANKDEIHQCERCKLIYAGLPTLSKTRDQKICPRCAVREAYLEMICSYK